MSDIQQHRSDLCTRELKTAISYIVHTKDESANALLNAGKAYICDGSSGRLFKSITSAQPKAFAGFGSVVAAGALNTNGTLQTIVGAPFEDADLDGEDLIRFGVGVLDVNGAAVPQEGYDIGFADLYLFREGRSQRTRGRAASQAVAIQPHKDVLRT
jgi:hypothetical protein